jgi:hypothetical protein
MSSSQATINLWRCGRNPRSEAALAALLSSPSGNWHCGRWYRSGGYTTTKARQGEMRWGQGPLRSRAAGKKCCYPGLSPPSKPKPKLASRGAGFNISTATNICSSSQATTNLWRCGRNPRSEAALAALLSSPIVHCGRGYRSGGYTTTKARQGEDR